MKIELVFLNLLIIMVPLLLTQLILNVKGKLTGKAFLVSLWGISILLCMTYSIQLSEDFIYDLRHIILWFGTVYGGPLVGFFLFAISAIYRFFIGGLGFYSSTIIMLFIVLAASFIRRKFLTQSPKVRVQWSTVFSLIFLILSGVALAFLYHFSFLSWNLVLLAVIQIIGTILIGLVIEMIKKQERMKKFLIKSEKVEVVSHLAASISHEIRNPLTASRGFMQLIKEGDLPKSQLNHYVQIAIDEMDRAEDIIRNYLTFAKPALIEKEVMDIKSEMEKMITIMTPLMNMNGVVAETNLTSTHIYNDSGNFQQCFINILKNSIESMPSGGNLKIYNRKDLHHVHIFVHDSGCGMSQKQIDRLGEPYFSTKEGKGTGLGMMVVFSLIEIMQGDISIESEVGKGTLVQIKLPIAENSAVLKEQPTGVL